MSSDVCPFCGKAFKRLKSHLPYCKAAASSKTPPTKQAVTANQTAASSEPTAALTGPAAKGKKSAPALSTATSPQSKKSKKVSKEESSTPTRSSSPATQLQKANTSSSSHLLSPSPASKRKKKKLSEEIKTANVPSATDILSSQSRPLPLSPIVSKPKKKKKSQKEAAKRDNFWHDSDEEFEDLSVKLGSGHQARITLQDAKATLGRVNTTHRSSIPSILNQIQTTDDLNSKIRPGSSLSPVLLPTGNQDVDQPSQTRSPRVEPQSVTGKTSKTEQTSLVPLRHDEPTKLPSPAAPLLSGLLSSQASRAEPPPHTLSMNEGLKVGLSEIPPSLSQISGPHLLPPAAQSILARMETLRADEESMREKSQLRVKKQNPADTGVKDALTSRRLGQVRLRELPRWLAYKTPGRPRDVVEMVQRGWQWYYKRYIDVRKGGVGGLGMLLAGYCVLSYIWSYPHIKLDRWRKHH